MPARVHLAGGVTVRKGRAVVSGHIPTFPGRVCPEPFELNLEEEPQRTHWALFQTLDAGLRVALPELTLHGPSSLRQGSP